MAEIYQLPENGNNGNATIPFSIPIGFGRMNNGGFGFGNGMNGICDLLGVAIIASLFGWGNGGFGFGGNAFGGAGGAGFISNQLNNDSGRELIMNAITHLNSFGGKLYQEIIKSSWWACLGLSRRFLSLLCVL